MPATLFYILQVVLAIYVLLGILSATAFVLYGAGNVDPAAKSGSAGFRWLIYPAAILLWPLLIYRWKHESYEPPQERNAHRDAARRIHQTPDQSQS